MQSVCAILFVIYGLPRCTMFSYIIFNGKIFGRKVLNIQFVFRFSLLILSEICLVVLRIKRDIFVTVRRHSCDVPVILVRIQ